MQVLPLSGVLVPVGAGALVVLVCLAVLVVRADRRRRRQAAESVAELTTAPVQPTVAHAVAIREADTTPLPISSAAVLARSESARAAGAVPVEGLGSKVRSEDLDHDIDAPPAAFPVVPPRAVPLFAVPAPVAEEPEPEPEPEVASEPEPEPDADEQGPDTTGSNAAFATAVSQVLAARAAAGVPRVAAVPAPRGDARDRLLAVLLDDPARAVGATRDLELCTTQLTHLGAAVTHERSVLSSVLSRLSAAGLKSDQVAHLAGMPLAEVDRLLDEKA